MLRPPRTKTRLLIPLALAFAACSSQPEPPASILPPAALEPVIEKLSAFIKHEMESKRLSALSIALVDDKQTVWAAGFGEARPGVPADAATIYRVGSLSKLFTDLAVMQLVERGTLSLDEPVTTRPPWPG